MKFRPYFFAAALVVLFAGTASPQALEELHGDIIYRAENVHAGNLIRVTFMNTGMMGAKAGDQSVVYGGEWPIGSGQVQLGNASAYVMSELRLFAGLDSTGTDSVYVYVTPAIFCEGWDPNRFSYDSLGVFQGFEPLPNFLNLTQKEEDPDNAVAMSHQAYTWPSSWPDKAEAPNDPGWSGAWNGYFGKDQKNADEESYFVMDDYQYKKRIKGLELPKPLEDQPLRGGLGLRLSVRGLQWSNPDAEDCLFWLYEIKNFGELNLDKTLFGANVGASNGATVGQNTDWDDDDAQFFREKSLAVNFDNDNIGTGGYSPVPYVGFAFLESPGNPFDGIDNDGDGGNIELPGGGTGKVIDEMADFYRFYDVGETVVLIDYESERYDRYVTPMPAEGLVIEHLGRTYRMKPNAPLEEIPRNGFDDNLNGLIDEIDGTVTQDSVEFFLYVRSEFNDQEYLAVDYFTGDGLENLLIDERRDDKIDNDADWDSEFDDVGLDGKPGTGDEGEGDGVPTPGYDNLPGEPNIDQVDVDESDQIGLTSFKFYIYGSLEYSNDDQMWDFSRPGYFDNQTESRADYDYVFSSGYFPLRPGQKESFSIALIYGIDETDILRNKETVQKIYNSNYNFALAPTKPTVTAVAGDGIITLYWDDEAEESFDRFLRAYDFEGYKVYKSTHHTFEDAGQITDGLGYERFKQPLAIYDKVDNVFGYFAEDFGNGVLFNLGNETGLVHKYVDTDVMNGVRYYYAITAYDQGDMEKNIGPSETTMFVNVDQSGDIKLSENVVAVTPQAPSLGFEEADFEIHPRLLGKGKTTGFVGVNILNPDSLHDGDRYEIQFLDKSVDNFDNNFNGLIDAEDPLELLPDTTTGFVITNTAQNTPPDTVMIKSYAGKDSNRVMIRDLYDDRDGNPRTLTYIYNGMEIMVYNPEPTVYHSPEEGIHDGVQWSETLRNLDKTYNIKFSTFSLFGFEPGTPYPRQYEVVFFDELVDTTTLVRVPLASGTGAIPIPPIPVNFKVYDKISGKELPFALVDAAVDEELVEPGYFSAKDNIIFFEELPDGSQLITYSLLNNDVQDTVFYNANGRLMGWGDTLSLYPDMPYNHNTVFEYKVRGQKINLEEARLNMDDIRVVPNPYSVTALWEPHNPYTSGRGPRKIEFINLPAQCTIRIYAVDGTLVRTLEHDEAISNGAEPWDLMTMDNMEIAYGVYIYHVDAPGVGEHVGRLLIIK